MNKSRSKCAFFLVVLWLGSISASQAATILVARGGNLQTALDSAQPGDTVLLEEGAEFVGNFVLPVKSGTTPITLRTSAPDTVLPPSGTRIQPSQKGLLARLRSPNSDAALRTAVGAHHWTVKYLEFAANYEGNGDIVQIGDGSSAQDTIDKVPHHITLTHLYVHGDSLWGQKRGIALNAASVTIRDSYVADCKGVGQDTQAIGGWNGPGPYTIENNYLEAAGENVMFGGADPSILNLVATGITFRRNYVTRPMSWRNPILSTPGGVTAARETGGSLRDGVYAYRVVAQGVARGNVTPEIEIRSTASAEATATATGGASAVRVRWQAVAGATEYRVYGRSAGAQALYWTVTGTQFLDTGAAGTSEAVPTKAGQVWNVKNIFELKSARNVVVEENIFENHWKEGQPGFAIVLTPRNSNGGCNWCVVENVRFEYNLLVNLASGFNVLGYDGGHPTKQTNHLALRHNVATGMNTSLGGPGRFMQIGEGPRDIVLEHNTVDANGSGVVYVYGGSSTDPLEVYGLEMRANAARHGSYGIHGTYFGYGNDTLSHYYPDNVFDNNYLAGASASHYPSGTIVLAPFEDQFADAAAGDYTIRAGSVLKGGALDGSDVGADYAALWSRVKYVRKGGSGTVSTQVHAALSKATTKKWTSASGLTNYWSSAFTVAAHDAGEHPMAGATITAAWSGAVVSTVSCVTGTTGQCTFQSGTLSYGRTSVTLTVTGVSATSSTYNGAANHTPSGTGSFVTAIRP
jgi:hypothetical protein